MDCLFSFFYFYFSLTSGKRAGNSSALLTMLVLYSKFSSLNPPNEIIVLVKSNLKLSVKVQWLGSEFTLSRFSL